jgi:hypothetical protein
MSDLIKIAHAWREKNGYVGRGGVIVIYDNTADAWMDQLRNPEHWQPGCIAVAEGGKSWTAIAGNEQDGALMWLPNDQIVD